MARRLAVVTWLALGGGFALHAAGLATRIPGVETGRFPEIALLVHVFEEKGRAVAGLTREHVTVDEDGQKVAVLGVDLEQAPLIVALAVDASGSMAPAMDRLKSTAGDFIRGLEARDRVVLIAFGSRARISQRLTDDRVALLNAIRGLTSEGATALHDALWMALEDLRGRPGRRLIVLFTDGRDQNAEGTGPQSAYSARAVAQRARAEGVPVWTVGMGPSVDRRFLARLAEVTGGHHYLPRDASQLGEAFTRVLADVRLQYRVRYVSPRPRADGTERTVTVRAAHGGAQGQARARYLAPAAPAARRLGSGGGEAQGEVRTLVAQAGQVRFEGFPDAGVLAWPYQKEWLETPSSQQLVGSTRTLLVLPIGRWNVEITGQGQFVVEIKRAGDTVVLRSANPVPAPTGEGGSEPPPAADPSLPAETPPPVEPPVPPDAPAGAEPEAEE